MLTSFARLGCYLPFHRALYKSSVLQPIQIWKMLKDTSCAPNSFYLNVIAQKYTEDSVEREFIVEWMLEGLKQGLRRIPSPVRLPSLESVSPKKIKPLPAIEPAEKASSTVPLEFGYLRGDANWKDDHVVINTKNIKGPFRFMGLTSILNESYMALFDNSNRLKENMNLFTKLKSLKMAMNGKIKLESSFGFVRILAQSLEIEALLYKDIKLIVLSRDENDTMQYVYPQNPYVELKYYAEQLQYIKLSVKPTDIVLLMKRQCFLPEPTNEDSAVKELKPHDLCGVFYFCELKVFDQLFRLLTKHIYDRTQVLGLYIVGGFVYTPSEESKDIISKWNNAF